MTFLEGALSFSLIPLGLSTLNLLTWRKPRPLSGEGPRRAVSVLIPARNEEKNIEALLLTVLDQEDVREVLVCDDNSTDQTAARVFEVSRRDARVRLVRGGTLPDGWVGKPYACHQLAEEARGEILLFLDADVRLERGSVPAIVRELSAGSRERLVTLVPRQMTGSVGESLVLPFLLLTYLAWLPLGLVARGRSERTVAACGQLLALERATYDKIGGFSSIRSAIVDDVALCRRAKSLGIELCFLDGVRLASCRMYDGFSSVWRGFSKNIFEGLSRSVPALLLALTLYFVTFVLPFGALFLTSGVAQTLALTSAIGWVVFRLLLVVTHGQPLLGALLHPVGGLLLIGIALNSARWSLSGKIEWAGRRYAGRRA